MQAYARQIQLYETYAYVQLTKDGKLPQPVMPSSLMPVHVEDHWVLIYIHSECKIIFYLDSYLSFTESKRAPNRPSDILKTVLR